MKLSIPRFFVVVVFFAWGFVFFEPPSRTASAQEDLSKTILEELAARLNSTIIEIYPTNKIDNVAESGYFISFNASKNADIWTHAVRLFMLKQEYGSNGGEDWAKRDFESHKSSDCSEEVVPFHGGTAYISNCLNNQTLSWGISRWAVTVDIFGHYPPDAITVAETLFQIGVEKGLFEGDQSLPELPSADPEVSCSLRPEIGKPLVLEADFKDGQGNYLKNQSVWISGDGEFGRLINLDNPLTTGKDWVALSKTGLLVETNSYGRIALPAAVALNNAMAPISPFSPLTGGLNFTMPGPNGTSVPLGHCDFSIDYIAMSNFYYGAVGIDPAGDEYPPRCLLEVGLSGKPLSPKFTTFTSGDVLYIGSCGITGSQGFTNGGIVIEYIDDTAVSVQYKQPDWLTLTDHPPFGEYIIGHKVMIPSISADHSPLLTFGFNKSVEFAASEAAEFSIKLLFKKGLGPATMFFTELIGNYVGDQIAPLTFQEQNIMALRVVRLRSLMEVSYEQPGGEIRFRTFEGNPEIFSPDTNTTVTLNAGQEILPFLDNPVVRDFDPNSAERWWDSPEWQAVNAESGVEAGGDVFDGSNLGRSVLWLALCGCGIVLVGIIGVLAFVFIRRKKSGPTQGQRIPASPKAAVPPKGKTRPFSRNIVILVSIAIFLLACCGVTGFLSRNWIRELFSGGVLPRSPSDSLASQFETVETQETTSAPDGLQPTLPTNQESPQSPITPPQNGLNQAGPWVVFQAEDGLWAFNPDGSGLTHLVHEKIVAPSNLAAGYSPGSGTLAFVTASDAFTLQNLTLKLLKLPEGTVETITRLTSSATEPSANFEVCDPKYEAARAVTIDDGLGWSRDGRQLAFIGAMQGPTADLYVYSLDNGSITRLTDGPSQAYGVYWSNSNQYIVHFGASCFGTGAGFNMVGAWAANVQNGQVIDLYTPNPESYGEEFVANVWGPNDAFYVTSLSGCPYRDLRQIDIETQAVTPIITGCFDDYALGPTNLLAVLISEDFSSDPGLYIFEVAGVTAPLLIPEKNGRQVEIFSDLVLVKIIDFSQPFPQIRSVDMVSGSPGWYSGVGDFPRFSLDWSSYAWLENEVFYLGQWGTDQLQVLSTQGVRYPFWYEEVGASMEEVRQHLIFFAGAESATLYIASDPDYAPIPIGSGLSPLGDPILVFSTR